MNGKYDDIICLPHHVSETRPRMSNYDRAAQFMPFSALSGYDAAILETARLTEQKIELADSELAVINEALSILRTHIQEQPEVEITYFKPDSRKQGGAYCTATGNLRKIDELKQTVVLADRVEIPVGDILHIDSELLQGLYGYDLEQ